MERRTDIQYIYFYSDGNAARVPEPAPKKKKRAILPKAPRKPVQVIHLDMTSVCGILMASILMVTMVFGLIQLRSVKQQKEEMQRYVHSLQSENAELRYAYKNSYDAEEVRERAEAMGYIPMEQARTQSVILPAVAPVREATIWDKITAFFMGIFA